MRRSARRIVILVCLLGGCLIGIPVASVIWKQAIGFSGFKEMVATKIRPGILASPEPLHIADLADSPLVMVGSLSLFASWTPEKVQDDYDPDLERVRVRLNAGETADITVEPLAGCPDLFLTRGNSILLLGHRTWGSWDTFARQFRNDRELLTTILETELPSYVDRSSSAMHTALGRAFLPLFPAAKNYRKEYALLAMKAIQFGNCVQLLEGKGRNLYFIARGPQARRMAVFFGDGSTGDLLGEVVIHWPTGTDMNSDLVGRVCFCLDRSPVLRNWPARKEREKIMPGWQNAVLWDR